MKLLLISAICMSAISLLCFIGLIVCFVKFLKREREISDRDMEEKALVTHVELSKVYHSQAYWDHIFENGKYRIHSCDAWLSSGESVRLDIRIPNTEKP